MGDNVCFYHSGEGVETKKRELEIKIIVVCHSHGTTGGTLKFAKKVGTGFKVGGWGLGLYNGYSINEQYRNEKISGFQMVTEQMSNGVSTFGRIYGTKGVYQIGVNESGLIFHRNFVPLK